MVICKFAYLANLTGYCYQTKDISDDNRTKLASFLEDCETISFSVKDETVDHLKKPRYRFSGYFFVSQNASGL